jgi:prefoldin subunit 5
MPTRRFDDIIAALDELDEHIEHLYERCRQLEQENRRLRGAALQERGTPEATLHPEDPGSD